MEIDRLQYRGQNIQWLGGKLKKEIGPHGPRPPDGPPPYILKLERVDAQTAIHIRNLALALRRPKAFCNRHGARPHPRVHGFRIELFGPHAHLAAQDQLLLVSRQGGVSGDRISEIHLRRALLSVEIVGRREDPLIPLSSAFGQRSLSPPTLDENRLGQSRIENLIPPNHLLIVLLENLF